MGHLEPKKADSNGLGDIVQQYMAAQALANLPRAPGTITCAAQKSFLPFLPEYQKEGYSARSCLRHIETLREKMNTDPNQRCCPRYPKVEGKYHLFILLPELSKAEGCHIAVGCMSY